MSIRSENIQMTIFALNSDFSGRMDTPGYDPTKPIHIHRRNRAYVWSKEMQAAFKDSILKGYYIPPIICCSRIVDGFERREVMEGGNRITTIRRLLNGDFGPLTPEEIRVIESHPITLVVMRNLNSKQTREMFRRLNKSVAVSDGQLYAMSEDDSPLVREALSLLNDDDHPLRVRINDYFFDTRNKDNDGKRLLENAIALVSGSIYGVEYITKSFSRQEEKVEDQTPIDRNQVCTILAQVFDVFRQANDLVELTDRRTMKSQFNVGKYLAFILYDLLTNPDSIAEIQVRWAEYLARVRRYAVNAEEAIAVHGAQNLNTDRLKRTSVKVKTYMTENRIMPPSELNQYHHESGESEESEEEDLDI